MAIFTASNINSMIETRIPFGSRLLDGANRSIGQPHLHQKRQLWVYGKIMGCTYAARSQVAERWVWLSKKMWAVGCLSFIFLSRSCSVIDDEWL